MSFLMDNCVYFSFVLSDGGHVGQEQSMEKSQIFTDFKDGYVHFFTELKKSKLTENGFSPYTDLH